MMKAQDLTTAMLRKTSQSLMMHSKPQPRSALKPSKGPIFHIAAPVQLAVSELLLPRPRVL
jgi:hypothetical protein